MKPQNMKPTDDDPIRALILTGDDINTLAADDWDVVVGAYTEIVFARTTPEQKLTIVEEIKARGDNTVAVTGDGVNDAPALKASDVGVAMGSGSDVAKEAGKLVSDVNDFHFCSPSGSKPPSSCSTMICESDTVLSCLIIRLILVP
jgi:sodium/potassium-transporting ATPase subunit alpha